jgi:hypothetical protein
MIEDWGMGHVVANGFGFSLTAFVTGAITDAIGQAFGNVPGFPGPLVYFLFFLVLPIAGFFSDTWEMLARGMIFTVSVAFFSSYVFNDVWEVGAALLALVIALIISYWNDQTRW